jgi:hypothetical protein
MEPDNSLSQGEPASILSRRDIILALALVTMLALAHGLLLSPFRSFALPGEWPVHCSRIDGRLSCSVIPLSSDLLGIAILLMPSIAAVALHLRHKAIPVWLLPVVAVSICAVLAALYIGTPAIWRWYWGFAWVGIIIWAVGWLARLIQNQVQLWLVLGALAMVVILDISGYAAAACGIEFSRQCLDAGNAFDIALRSLTDLYLPAMLISLAALSRWFMGQHRHHGLLVFGTSFPFLACLCVLGIMPLYLTRDDAPQFGIYAVGIIAALIWMALSGSVRSSMLRIAVMVGIIWIVAGVAREPFIRYFSLASALRAAEFAFAALAAWIVAVPKLTVLEQAQAEENPLYNAFIKNRDWLTARERIGPIAVGVVVLGTWISFISLYFFPQANYSYLTMLNAFAVLAVFTVTLTEIVFPAIITAWVVRQMSPIVRSDIVTLSRTTMMSSSEVLMALCVIALRGVRTILVCHAILLVFFIGMMDPLLWIMGSDYANMVTNLWLGIAVRIALFGCSLLAVPAGTLIAIMVRKANEILFVVGITALIPVAFVLLNFRMEANSMVFVAKVLALAAAPYLVGWAILWQMRKHAARLVRGLGLEVT